MERILYQQERYSLCTLLIAYSLFSCYRWSVSDVDAIGSNIDCPKPEKGKYECGLQVQPKVIETKGKVREKRVTTKEGRECYNPTLEDGPWEEYTVCSRFPSPSLTDTL